MEGGSEKSREFPSTYYRLDSATGNRSFKLGNSEQEHVITTPTGGLQHDDRRLAFNRQNSVRQSPNFLTPISIIPNEFVKPQLSRSLSSNANNSFSRRPQQPNSFYSPRVPDTSKHQHHHHHHHAFESSRNGSCLIEDGSLGHQKSAMRMILRAIVEVCTCGTRPMKSLFALILMNVAYSSLELLIGLFTGRVGLVSDAFHLSFGCGLLSFSLIAMVVARKKPDDVYTYGYKRVEVLAAFTNTLFLLFLSFSLAVEALHAFVQDEEEHKHYLIVSAASNLLVNLIGVWFFRGYARINIVYRKAEDMNYHSICLHVLSDSIRSAGLILASWLLTLGVKNAEMLCLGLVSVAIFVVVLPLFKASGGILLQTAPTGMASSAFNKCLRQVNAFEDVIEVSQVRFWDLVPGYIVGQISLQIKKGSEENRILKHIHSLFNDIGVKDLTIQTEFV